MAEAVKGALFVRNALGFLAPCRAGNTIAVHEDNEGANSLADIPSSLTRSRQIDVWYCFLREKVANEDIKVEYVENAKHAHVLKSLWKETCSEPTGTSRRADKDTLSLHFLW